MFFPNEMLVCKIGAGKICQRNLPLFDLKPGESFEVDRPSHTAVYRLAQRQKMRVSLRQIDKCRFWITRIA